MINKFQMSVEDNVEFAKRQIVDSIYKEARVEGVNRIRSEYTCFLYG